MLLKKISKNSNFKNKLKELEQEITLKPNLIWEKIILKKIPINLNKFIGYLLQLEMKYLNYISKGGQSEIFLVDLGLYLKELRQ